jgi:hypothetical protein
MLIGMVASVWTVFYLNRARGSGMIQDVRPRARAVLAAAAGTHFLHDGFSDILYVLLPLWAAEFRLSFTQVGMIRTAYSGGMALFQIPAGFLAERWGERRLLVGGTVVTALGFVAAGSAGGFASLLAILLLAGLGSGVQHPLSSSIVSKAYETGSRRAALGTYNFSGDLGKVAVPAAVAFAATAVGWRVAGAAYGVLGLAAALVLFVVLRHLGAGGGVPAVSRAGARTGWGIRDGRGFGALAAIGMIDNATRTGFITFLPFALIAKGATVTGIGTALALLFAGGAQVRLRAPRRARRGDPHRRAHGDGDRGGHPRGARGSAPAGAGRAAAHGRGAQRDVVRAVRDGGRPRDARAPLARLRPLLHAQRRGLVARALGVRNGERCRRRAGDAGDHRRVRAGHDPALPRAAHGGHGAGERVSTRAVSRGCPTAGARGRERRSARYSRHA